MMPDDLDPNLLYVFVCGPGQGESIAIRVPENEWIVIDSCRTSGKVFATHVLRKYGGNKCCLVLTHRHRDHYRGFSDLVAMEEWSVLGCNDRTLGPADETHDAEEKLSRELDQVFSTIRRRWAESKDTQWLTWRGSKRQVGDARLLTLHPDEDFAQSYPSSSNTTDENVLSSAMMLQWKDNNILLAADTPNPYWEEIVKHFGDSLDIASHVFCKIPHHGSIGSIASCVLNNDLEQTWVVTPFNSGSKLPSFDEGGGIESLLNANPEVHLTGLPVAHANQQPSPCKTTLLEVRSGTKPEPILFTLPGLVGVDVTPTKGKLKNYVIASIDPSGETKIVKNGAGSVLVTK